MGEATEPLYRRLLLSALFGAVSAAAGFFLKAVLESWGIVEPLARQLGMWLNTHVSAIQFGWLIAFAAALGLWLFLLHRFWNPRTRSAAPAEAPQTVQGGAEAAVSDERRTAAVEALIEVLFDKRYLVRADAPAITRERLSTLFNDSVICSQTTDLTRSAALPEIMAALRKQQLLEAAQASVVERIREDWEKLVPSTKAAIKSLASRYPFLGLGALPELTEAEKEVAAIKWRAADAIFEEVWDSYVSKMAGKGFDLTIPEFAPDDFKDDVKIIAEETARLIRDKIQIDTALVEVSLKGDYHRVENSMRARAAEIYWKIIQAVNEIASSYGNPSAMIEHLSKPIQREVEPLLAKPMLVGTTRHWLTAVREAVR